jgi:2-isopropylmalate synthase
VENARFDHRRFDHRKYRAFQPIAKPDRRWPDNVIQAAPEWCSVDLRDGNQALVEPMNAEQKLRLWELLVSIGFKQIEVGFPSASSHDFAFLRKLIEEQRIPDDVTVQVLVQAREDLIEKTFVALEGVKRAVVHFYNSTSTVQREYVFGLDRDGIRDIAVNGARLIKEAADARPETEWVFEYSPESFTGHGDGFRHIGLRCGERGPDTDPGAAGHYQPARYGGNEHAQHLCRSDRVVLRSR